MRAGSVFVCVCVCVRTAEIYHRKVGGHSWTQLPKGVALAEHSCTTSGRHREQLGSLRHTGPNLRRTVDVQCLLRPNAQNRTSYVLRLS